MCTSRKSSFIKRGRISITRIQITRFRTNALLAYDSHTLVNCTLKGMVSLIETNASTWNSFAGCILSRKRMEIKHNKHIESIRKHFPFEVFPQNDKKRYSICCLAIGKTFFLRRNQKRHSKNTVAFFSVWLFICASSLFLELNFL